MSIRFGLIWLVCFAGLVVFSGCRAPDNTDTTGNGTGDSDSDSDSDTDTDSDSDTDTDTDNPLLNPVGGCPDGSWDEFDNELAPILGGEVEALVEVSIATDFHCPSCLNFAMLMIMDLNKRPWFRDYVKIYYHHHPLFMHPDAWEVHYASAAVALQSYPKFWEFHDQIFEREQEGDRMSIEEVVEYVEAELDLDMEQFNADRVSEEIADYIIYERDQAIDLGLGGTPSTWVCGTKIYWVDMPDAVETLLLGGSLDDE